MKHKAIVQPGFTHAAASGSSRVANMVKAVASTTGSTEAAPADSRQPASASSVAPVVIVVEQQNLPSFHQSLPSRGEAEDAAQLAQSLFPAGGMLGQLQMLALHSLAQQGQGPVVLLREGACQQQTVVKAALAHALCGGRHGQQGIAGPQLLPTSGDWAISLPRLRANPRSA